MFSIFSRAVIFAVDQLYLISFSQNAFGPHSDSDSMFTYMDKSIYMYIQNKQKAKS